MNPLRRRKQRNLAERMELTGRAVEGLRVQQLLDENRAEAKAPKPHVFDHLAPGGLPRHARRKRKAI